MLRIMAVIAMAAGVILGAAQACIAATSPQPAPGILLGVLILVALGCLGALMVGVADLLQQPHRSHAPEPSREMLELLRDVQGRLERLEMERSMVVAAGEVAPAGSIAQAAPTPEASMQRALAMLQEIRDLSLLSDSQRQQRLAEARKRRRDSLVAETQRLAQGQQWTDAAKTIAQFDQEFPGDGGLDDLKQTVAAGEQAAESREYQSVVARVEDQMAMSAWEQAHDTASRFLANHPHSREGVELLSRVVRERDLSIEALTNQLFDEIKFNLDRRQWRRALAGAQKLLQKSPDHRRTAIIKGQLKTIQENAEIEERQEQERNIQELVRSRRFHEAIQLAEDLLARFPTSPQAEELREMLPKMRGMAIEQDMHSELESSEGV